MTRLTLPADAESAVAEVGVLAALLDKNGWKAAAFIAVSVKPDVGHGGRRETSTSGRLSPRAFAKSLNDGQGAKGWSHEVIRRHYNSWETAADKGLVTHAAELVYGERIEVPADGWSVHYPPRWAGQEGPEAVAAQAREDGFSPTTAVTVSQNPGAMAAAIKSNPKVRAVAAAAIEEADPMAAIETAQRVLEDPDKADIVMGNRRTRTSASQAAVRASRAASGASPELSEELSKKRKERESAGSPVVTLLSVHQLMNEIERDLNIMINQLIEGSDGVTPGTRKSLIEWVDEMALPAVNTIRDLSAQ